MAYMQDQTITGVIDQLDAIIERCHDRGSRLGFFPAMYRKTTVEVKNGIESGRFEIPERMERLDVVFAARYLHAYDQQERGEETTAAWNYAFQMGQSLEPTVIQHLLLGMNAHINLDLGISAADVAPGESLASLRRDFDEINTILGELIDQMQDDLASVFPLVRILDRLCHHCDEAAAHLVIRQARATAWDKAVELAVPMSESEKQTRIAEFDRQTVRMARTICPTDWRQTGLSSLVSKDLSDVGTVRRVIEALVG